mmetsp:Transcript_33566/g.79150  ORF Transcript_33566/g.79150 Transcript_33566/m.79150 type:complete len:458 (+) Transcript_33566:127-1500(+)
MEEIEKLRERIRLLEEENARLRNCSDHEISREKNGLEDEKTKAPWSESSNNSSIANGYQGNLNRDEVERYSRQLLLHGGFGVEGQLKLLKSSVLIVGAGGIGSTVILYLAACGIGNLSVVDFDKVDLSNLHRQVIHKTNDVGLNKAESARRAVDSLNPSVSFAVVDEPLTAENALELISSSDCVVDASDNPQTRYIINDACVLGGVPLVSGSAMGTEGQLTVYNYEGGPCYRCMYPTPNMKEGSKSCADNGVLGPVPGLIGILQALETIKVITGTKNVMSERLLMYDSLECSFMRIKKPPRQQQCPVCGTNPTITTMEESFAASKMARGPSACSVRTRPNVPDHLSLSCEEYSQIRDRGEDHVLIDVRVKEQFDLCSLPGAINIPLGIIEQEMEQLSTLSDGLKPIYCMCRRGFASVAAMNKIVENAHNNPKIHSVKNITGGLASWRSKVDETFPKY